MKKINSSELSKALSEVYDVVVSSFKHQFLSYDTRRVLSIDSILFGNMTFNEWVSYLKPKVDKLDNYEMDIVFQILSDNLYSDSNLYLMKHIELSNKFSVLSADLMTASNDFTKKMFVYGVMNHLMLSKDIKLLEIDKDNFLLGTNNKELKHKVEKLFNIRIEILQLENKMKKERGVK